MTEILNRGPRVTLRRLTPDDAELIGRRAFGNAAFRRLYAQGAKPTPEGLRASVTEMASQRVPFGILEVGGEPIGMGGITHIDARLRRGELLGGLFDIRDRERRHGTEATMLVLDMAYNRLRLHRVVAQVYGYNDITRHALKGWGFVEEGVLEAQLLSPAGAEIDVHVLAQLEHDFRRSHLVREVSLNCLGRDITRRPARQPPDPGDP